jgi:hypothetical protein
MIVSATIGTTARTVQIGTAVHSVGTSRRYFGVSDCASCSALIVDG